MRAVSPLAEPPDFAPLLVAFPDPVPGPGEILVAVRATAINRADLLLLAGHTAEVDLAWVLRRRLRIIGSVLRPRTRKEKGVLVAAFARFATPLLDSGQLAPRIAAEFPFERIADAYRALGEGGIGKVVVTLP